MDFIATLREVVLFWFKVRWSLFLIDSKSASIQIMARLKKIKTGAVHWHISLQWRHNGHDGVSNHQPRHCLLTTVYSDADQRKLAFVRGIHRWPGNSPHKWPVTRKMFSFDDVIIVWRAGLLWSQQDFEWRWSVPLFKCLTVLEFSFILFDLCLLITFFNFIMNYVPIVTFWIFTCHKIWILSIMFCFIWSYWIIYFLACLEVSWRVVS